MNRIAATLGFVAASLVAGAAAAAPPPHPAAQERTEPRAAASSVAAYESARRAWLTEKSASTAAALGHAELQLGLARDAAEHLAFALRHPPDADSFTPEVVFDSASARRYVVTLRVHVSRDRATIFLDDVEVGQSPMLTELFVEEGAHELRVMREGFGDVARSVAGHMGEVIDLDVTLTPATFAPSRPSASPMPVAATKARQRNPWIILGGSILGAATLAAGTGFAIAAGSDSTRFEQYGRDAGVHFAVGSLIVGATLTYALLPASTDAPAPTVVPAAAIGPGAGTVGLVGRF